MPFINIYYAYFWHMSIMRIKADRYEKKCMKKQIIYF